MDRNYLIGSHGDAANPVLGAVGYNFARLISWLRRLLCALLPLLIAARSHRTPALPIPAL
jgi:IS5 family transposase